MKSGLNQDDGDDGDERPGANSSMEKNPVGWVDVEREEVSFFRERGAQIRERNDN